MVTILVLTYKGESSGFCVRPAVRTNEMMVEKKQVTQAPSPNQYEQLFPSKSKLSLVPGLGKAVRLQN